MKWFHLIFSQTDLTLLNDEKLVKQFIQLCHQLKRPEGLALYELKFRVEEGKVFYLSTPDEYSYKVKNILAHFNCKDVSEPNLNVLSLILGKALNS